MVITTLFSHAAREQRNVERLVLQKLAKNGYPETALLMETGLQKADAGYRLDFDTWETNEHYVAFATRVDKRWQVSLQIGDQNPQQLN
ncbi:hypothetical protein [Lacticaseibacillus porcinae]|uniref:hypothetical protein n=1 Tax=Lacticaseibacillus porcinae TaxID=1123687 RepID=UPI000F79F868|nr:hypothetical protein [Lacticaseibacillus porcinae]